MVALIGLTEKVHVYIADAEYSQDLFVARSNCLWAVCGKHTFADDLLSLIQGVKRRPGISICLFLHPVFSCYSVTLVLYSVEYKYSLF